MFPHDFLSFPLIFYFRDVIIIADIRISSIYAGVLELADEVDSKSVASDGVRVRPPPPALHSHPDFDRVRVGLFFSIFDELPGFSVFSEHITHFRFLLRNTFSIR